MSPGSSALFGLIWPEPMARGFARGWLVRPMSVIGLPVLSVISDVVMMADRIAAGLHSGCAAFKSAATPDA